MTHHNQQGGTLVIVSVIVLVLALLGSLGFIFYQNFIEKKSDETVQTDKTESTETKEEACESSAADGVFCNKDIGVSLAVPAILKGKFAVANNYDVYQGVIDASVAGQSIAVYEATVTAPFSTDGSEFIKEKIALEPKRGTMAFDGYFKFYYNDQTNVLAPYSEQDAAGKVEESTIGGVKAYKYVMADAGFVGYYYFIPLEDNILRVELTYRAYLGADTAETTKWNDSLGVAATEFDKAVAALVRLAE